MEKYIYIKTNKYILNKCLYVKNDKNDKNKGNINNSLYITGLNNNNKEKKKNKLKRHFKLFFNKNNNV